MQEKVLNDTKDEIRSVLLTYQNGVVFQEFLKTYQSLSGKRIPSRTLGFSSDIDFLKSMPDVVHVSMNSIGRIMLTGIANEASEHIQKLVKKQRTARPNNRSNRNDQRYRKPDRLPSSRECQTFVPGAVRAEILQLMTMYPDGISFSVFVLAYRKKFNKYLSLERGLETLEGMIKTISELEIKPVKNEKKIFLKNSPNEFVFGKTDQVRKNQASEKQIEGRNGQLNGQANDSSNIDKSGIPEAVQKNFQLILEKCPEGILAVHFPPLYENLTGKPFELLELGYNSILELVDALPWMFKRILDSANDRDWVILPANSPIKHIYQGRKINKRDNTEASLVSTHKKPSPGKSRETVPADAASPLLQYLPPTLPGHMHLDEYLPVFVSAIVSPGLFWFQLQTDEAMEELDKMETDIGSFYGSHFSHKYKMYDGDIVIGATCVVLCPDDRQWYRAVIKSIPTLDLVNVFFVDYGSRENVPRNMLHYVRSKYLDYPALAFKAQLAGLKPPKNVSAWDIRSQQRFIKFCECASLMAYLKLIDKDTFSADLCDTSGESDLHINDALIQEGYAEFTIDNPPHGNASASVSVSTVNGSHSDAESSCTVMSSDTALPEIKNSILNVSVNHTTQFSSQSEKEMFTSDSDDMSVKKKLSFVTDQKPNDAEAEVSALIEQSSKRFIKQLKLCEDTKISIINYKDKPYASAGDLSRLFWSEKDATYLAERLKYKEVVVPALEISKEDHAELFRQCLWYKLPDLELNSISLSLYPLEWAFNILNIFGHPSVCLRLAIQNEVRTFDPFAPIWKEFSYISLDDLDNIEKEIEEKLGKLCMYDLKAKYEALKIKRLKLLKINTTCATKEIERIEHLQFIISKRMEHIASLCSQYSTCL